MATFRNYFFCIKHKKGLQFFSVCSIQPNILCIASIDHFDLVKHRVTNFKPLFLSPLRSKLKNFSAHQKENFLRILKLTLHLFLVPFLRELWAFKTSKHFFWDTLYLSSRIMQLHVGLVISKNCVQAYGTACRLM